MSSQFTEVVRESGDVEVFASTNKYMRFALERLDISYFPIDAGGVARPLLHGHITQWFDTLLPIELKWIGYVPANKLMEDWADLLFYRRSRGGLIATEAGGSDRKVFTPPASLTCEDHKAYPQGKWSRQGDPASECRSWWELPVEAGGDPSRSFYGIVESLDASSIKSLHLMYEFLSWLPPDLVLPSTGRSLQEHCTDWAQAFMQHNQTGNGGHDAGGWALYNFVHTGPPNGTPLDTPDFDLQLRFALEGIPDSWWVIALDYSILAQAFVLLSKTTGVSDYAEFAARKNEGLWCSRFNHATYLMPDTVTPMGPLPGDPGDQRKYQSDTDCLYWALGIFDAYQVVGEVRNDLLPNDLDNFVCALVGFVGLLVGDTQLGMACQVRLRRARLAVLLDNEFPGKYLGMALGLTVDWIRYGWRANWRHFVRKINHDGTRSTNAMSGDGKYNTLRMLVAAYRATHDDFYLNIFDRAWARLEEFATHEGLNGFFPSEFMAGELPPEPSPDPGQESFIDFIVKAYTATVAAGQPRGPGEGALFRKCNTTRGCFYGHATGRSGLRKYRSRLCTISISTGYLATHPNGSLGRRRSTCYLEWWYDVRHR